MSNEVIEKEFYEIIPEEDFEFLIWFDEQEKRAKVIRDKLKDAGKDFLERNGLKETGYKQTKDGVTVHLYETKPYKKKQIDTQALKDQGLYEEFAKDVWVRGAIRIQIEYEDE